MDSPSVTDAVYDLHAAATGIGRGGGLNKGRFGRRVFNFDTRVAVGFYDDFER